MLLSSHRVRCALDSSRRHFLTVRTFATVERPTVVGPPPRIPGKSENRSHLDDQILSALSETQTGLTELIKQYGECSGQVLDSQLPYESRPSEHRRVNFGDDSTVAMIAHCVRFGKHHKMTVCSGFALDGLGHNGRGYPILTCAHTLEEIRHSPLLKFDGLSLKGFSSGSFVVSGSGESVSVQPISSILSALHPSDLVLMLSNAGVPSLKSLPVSPYPARANTPIRAHFVTSQVPDEPGWKPWVGGMWSKWVPGRILGYRDSAGRETQPGTYDSLSHMFFEPPPTPGASGGPIIDEESGAVVGVVLGTMTENRVQGLRGWGVPSETIFEMFRLPGLDCR